MNVTKVQILARGVSNRCPNCGRPTLFPPHSFAVNRRCPACGTGFDRGDGFYLGPWVLNYSVVVFGFVVPAIVLGAHGSLSWSAVLLAVLFGCVVLPALLYRATWSWWLMLYFFFLPGSLPANGGAVGVSEED